MKNNPRIKMTNMGSFVMLLICLYVILLVSVSPALSLPAEEPKQSEDEVRNEKERATWLETRNVDVEQNFEKMVFVALQELSNEGLIDSRILADKPPAKRGRHQGFCFRKTKTGRFLPYICWKGDNENEEK